ncbi:uncharacterized protein LOC135620062 [Musa acuminata AAA Group]|uniref:uncharacterized protein LOC135620062 n=1 Tax=Musa acuminata AAA Group TaxID=214697 RepID=UPI0031E07A40
MRFKAYYQSYGIQLRFSSIAHPQTNDQTKVMNQAIFEGLKRRVMGALETWVYELPSILWALRTTPKTASGESPFSLTFGTKAVLPPEIVFLTWRTDTYDENNSEEGLRVNLDLLEERRAKAHVCTPVYKKATGQLYNHKVCLRPIKAGDLILRKIEESDLT